MADFKKVLIVGQENLGKGGVQSVIISIVRALHEEYTFDIILLRNEKKDYDDEFLSYGGKIFYCPTYQGMNVNRLRADYYMRGKKLYRFTRKIIRENGPYHVIHCHAAIESAVFIKAAFMDHIPIRLVNAHGIHDIENENFIRQSIDLKYISWMKKYATNFLADSYEAGISHFGDEVKITIVPPAYNEVLFNPLEYPIKEKNNELVITQVGQYCPNKNQLFTVSVFSEIVKLHPEAQLNLVGFDSIGYLPIINEEIKKYGLGDKVVFHPHDADIPLLLSKTDAFLFPSHSEGFGIAVIEAQAMGVRCYASDTVPKTTDCGGCTYLSLEYGASEWANTIVDDFQNQNDRVLYDCSKFKNEEINNQYRLLYSGMEVK